MVITKQQLLLLLSFPLLILSVTDCKSRNHSSLEGIALQDAMMVRTNGDLDLLIRNTREPQYWRAFENGLLKDFQLNFATYAELWHLYQKIIVLDGDGKKPKQRVYKVRFYIQRDDLSKETKRASTTAPAPNKAVMAFGNSLTKTCPQDIAANSWSLTYDLLGMRQPNLARNLLILAKAGALDNRKFDLYELGLFYFGTSKDLAEPFFFAPDDLYTDSTPDFDKSKFEASGDERTKVPLTFDQAWRKMKAVTAYGALVGIAMNVVGFDETRDILPTKMGIAAFKSGYEEMENEYKKKKTYPVVFGRKVANDARPLDLASATNFLLKEKANFSSKAQLTVRCVEIFEPELKDLFIGNEEFPNFD